MEEETTEVSGGRQLADVLDIALPTQQRRGPQGTVLGAVIDIGPGPQSLVQLIERERWLAIRVVQELFSTRAEKAFDFPAAIGLIRRSVYDEQTDGCPNPRQLWTAIDLGIVHVEPDG